VLVQANLVALLVAGCASGVEERDRERAAVALQGVFGVFERNRVLLFQNDGCRALETPDGKFSDGSPPARCGIFVEGSPSAFNAASTSVFEEVRSGIADTGVPVQYAWFTYSATGTLIIAVFEVGCASPCESARLIYELGGIREDPGRDTGPGATSMPLRGDWLWHEEWSE
jgi:hypothetical protein